MTITVEATYENGTLKLSQPVPLKEEEKVQVTIQTASPEPRRGQGRIAWTGSLEDLDYLMNDPENDPVEGT
jgi:predicted DNA-binding antitoxin AbrB/MazE fold protein